MVEIELRSSFCFGREVRLTKDKDGGRIVGCEATRRSGEVDEEFPQTTNP